MHSNGAKRRWLSGWRCEDCGVAVADWLRNRHFITDLDAGGFGSSEASGAIIQLQEILANERAILSSYGWIDRDLGVVRIPIDRAMDVLAERGLPSSGDGAEEPQP